MQGREQQQWMEIVKRIEAGEKQTVIARELGLEVGKFRYRLRKFQNSLCAEPEPSQTLFDDSWTRRWSVSRLALMVKEPEVLFSYWEVDEQKKHLISKHFESPWENLPFYLRLYDVTDIIFDGQNAHSARTIQVPPDADNWYVQGVQPHRRYVMDFGTTTLRGDFFTILRSNVVQTPPLPTYRGAQGSAWFAPIEQKAVEKAFAEIRAEEMVHTGESEPSTLAIGRPYPEEFDGYSVRAGGTRHNG